VDLKSRQGHPRPYNEKNGLMEDKEMKGLTTNSLNIGIQAH
jgi:hypothetical protein